MNNIKKLDYTLKTAWERAQFVEQLLSELPPDTKLSDSYLEILSDYIVMPIDKTEKRKKEILTDNRLVTINKRETSFEGLVDKLENGEDGIYKMIEENKNRLLTPKVSITQKDIDEIPELKTLRDCIEQVAQAEKKAVGKDKYSLKKQLIEMRQDQYVIKNAVRKPIYMMHPSKSLNNVYIDENITVTPDGEVYDNSSISLTNPKHVSALLCNYSDLKQDAWGNFSNDIYYLMEDLDKLVDDALKDDYPLYYDLLTYKIDGLKNTEIQNILALDYGVKHSVEYISSLWRNKIPKLIADKAQEQYLMWYYTYVEKGHWKRCSRCGQVKLALNRFFSKNKTSKDGFYSICKECRNKKTKEAKKVK